MKKYNLLFSLLLLFSSGFSQHDFDSLYKASLPFQSVVHNSKDTFDIFNGDDPLEIKIYSDFKLLTRQKYDKEYQEAIFYLKYNDTVNIRREIKIKTRGNFRLENCPFPPIKLNFRKSELFSEKLQEFDKMKMVNNCRMQKSYEKYIIAEFLAYRMYNIITPFSFRVRLLKIEYVDTGRKNKSTSSFAFIIESKKQMAERLNTIIVDKKGIAEDRIDEISENRMALFQYMIGNTDFSIPSLHNIVLLKENSHLKLNPNVIPYDFDYSGIVNTPYAIPSENLPIENVRERLFLGSCHKEELFLESARFFMDKKEQLTGLIEGCPYLESGYKKNMLYYVNGFFGLIESKNGLERSIIYDCKE